MTRTFSMLALLSALAACGTPPGWPMEREGAWRPTGVNDANLRLMVADPSDLTAGRGTDRRVGPGATDAVDRLNRDRVRPLPDTAIARVGGSGAASGGASGGGTGGGLGGR
jgi:hypothetical protein